MIKKLRYKFLAVTMLCIGLLFALILISLNLFMTAASKRQGFDVLNSIADRPRDEFSGENDPPGGAGGGAADNAARSFSPGDTAPAADDASPDSAAAPDNSPMRGRNNYLDDFRAIRISYDSAGNVLEVFYNERSGLTDEDVLALGQKVQSEGFPEQGTAASKYLFVTRTRADIREIFFLDYSMEHGMYRMLFDLCLPVGLIGMIVLFIAVFFLSGWMVKPVENAFIRQKQFIADASHELKTPLTIITTNAEVLSATIGDNRWLSHIIEQSERMNRLIKSLLDLAKLDSLPESPQKMDFSEFDLSSAVSTSALSFESLAFESGKTFRLQIADGLSCYGNESSVKQLVTILLDNAFKYSDPGGTVTVSLEAAAKHLSAPASFHAQKILTVHNTGKGIAPEDQKRIFERFYRSDDSRSRDTGGYGLGLSIAEAIVSAHRGKISVQSDETGFTVSVLLS